MKGRRNFADNEPMTAERTAAGWRLSFKPHGCSRFVTAAFLTVWLCGWAAGEGFALWLLIQGGYSLLTGHAPSPGHQPLPPGMALAMGVFLLFWLTLWTVGGVAAGAELLRLLWGEDRIEVAGGRVIVTHKRGPFRTRRTYERSSIRRIAISGRDDRMVMESGRSHVDISALGTREERIEGMTALRAELGLTEEPPLSTVALPSGWEDIITPDGARVLVGNRSIRQKQARTAFIATSLLAALTFVVARKSVNRPDLLVPSIILLAFTLGAAAGSLWLLRGRWEWRIESGVLTLRKRYGLGVRNVFQGRYLVLEHSTDSDGDPWFQLDALSEPDAPPTVKHVGDRTITWRAARSKNRRPIARKLNDGGDLRNLGLWLARETGLELQDRTMPTARAQDLAELRASLEQTGRFGKLAAKLVDRLGDKTASER